jgi:gluconokinase
MGVSGCGKSTVGQALARALAVRYVEGDDLHPADNVAKMAAGIPLTDADRQGWLQSIAHQLADEQARQRGVVVTCSALKRSYRDVLRSGARDLQLVHLVGSPQVLAERLRNRQGHYMPASLLQSQLDTLEAPGADERALVVDTQQAPESIVWQVVQHLRSRQEESFSND